MKISTYFRASAASPRVRPADIEYNFRGIAEAMDKAAALGVSLLVTPECGLTGYTAADLFRQTILLDEAEDAAAELAKLTSRLNQTLIFGMPLRHEGRLYNCAVVASGGKIVGAVPKSFLPNYNEFYERRWFASGAAVKGAVTKISSEEVLFGTDLLFETGNATVGIEICEDLWVPVSPGARAALAGADIIANLSATDELIGKHQYLKNLITRQSASLRCGYVYASAGAGESSTDLVFAGNAIIAEDGVILAESKRFTREPLLECADIDTDRLRADRQNYSTFYDDASSAGIYRRIKCAPVPEIPVTGTLLRRIDPTPFVPADDSLIDQRCNEIISIQAAGLIQRLEATGCRSLVVGVSGGLDSTLALLIAAEAFDRLDIPREGIIGITMPGFGTTGRTHSNASDIMRHLGVTSVEIPIGEAVKLHFQDIGHNPDNHDVTYENSQARERTQILMDYANKTGGMVLGTGDLSELALGWCTYNGDHMSMYAVNSSVPKTLVKYLVRWFARSTSSDELRNALFDIIDTPISPELIPADEKGDITQKTEDLVGPYELHDFFLYNTLRNAFPPHKIYYLAVKAFSDRYDKETIKHWLRIFYRRFFSQQFKRSCMPDGPKVGSACLSPRGDWRMPSDASAALWLKETDEI